MKTLTLLALLLCVALAKAQITHNGIDTSNNPSSVMSPDTVNNDEREPGFSWGVAELSKLLKTMSNTAAATKDGYSIICY